MEMQAVKRATSSSSNSSGRSNQAAPLLLASISKTNNVLTTTLHRTIRHHFQNKEYNARTDGLDFLEAKNGLMLSYLIDLTLLLRFRLNEKTQRQRQHEAGDGGSSGSDDEASQNNARRQQPQPEQQCLRRLLEMKTALEKIRPLEKRMRYQIDKLLALSTLGAGTFAAVGREQEEGEEEGKGKLRDDYGGNDNALSESDPLSFKPDLQGMMKMFEEDDRENEHGSNSDIHEGSYDVYDDNDEESSSKPRVALEKYDDDPSNNSDIYQPPRHQSMPFEPSTTEAQLARQDRLLEKQRDRQSRSELTALLRSQYTDAPDEEDARGGTSLGKQSANSRRLAAQDDDIREFEEGQMIRLTMGRDEKRERKRVQREEMSNLGAIVGGLGTVVAGVGEAFGRSNGGVGDQDDGEGVEFKRKGMRKRKVEVLEQDQKRDGGRRSKKKSASNTYQKSLYGNSGCVRDRKLKKKK